ncbi:MAG: hypothetical protein ABEK50_13345 [bacterium]
MSPWGWHSHSASKRATKPLRPDRVLKFGSLETTIGSAVKRCNRELLTREVRVKRVRNHYFYYCLEMPGKSRLVPARSSSNGTMERFRGERLIREVRESLQGYSITNARVMQSFDNYYYPGRSTRLGAAPPRRPYLRVKVDDPAGSWFYVSLYNGQLIKTVRYLDRWNRWLYHGFHNLDFPELYRHNRGIWWGVMWILLVGGTGVSFTGVWLTGKWVFNQFKDDST